MRNSFAKTSLRIGAGKSNTKMKMLGGIALICLTVATSGCANYSRDHIKVGSIPDDYRTRHPILVSESERTEDIIVTRGSKGLSSRGLDSVKSMGQKFKTSGAKSIAILIPSGSANEASARSAASDAVKQLQEIGIPSSRIVIQHYDASSHNGAAALRVVYTDLVASVDSECGKWEEDITDTTANNNYENFGCATQNNLAQMIANPADLLGPRAVSEIDADKRTNAINSWRTRETSLDTSTAF